MRLKKLILCGFKSFAEKTEFEFTDGITVVVGPNGCGKSNIVDAIRWVLGEQSAKSLRGGQMLDVIFNGSGTRKSMGAAEVTLIFDNSSGLIHSDLEEISVTRKLYRSGESEYRLNNKNCRLKDIREMFLGTGIGADAYSIIEQGKVELLLQASKNDRRAVFEEAAGISKYKIRKKESLRKLERTEQNVLRLQDIIAELEKQLRSIKYQAGKARNYQTYSQRLKELRLNQFLAEYYQLQTKSTELKDTFDQQQAELMGLISQSEKMQARLSVLEHEIDKCNEELRLVDNEYLQCTSQIGSQEERIEMNQRRCRELEDLLDKSRKQIRSLRQRKTELEQEILQDRQEMQNTDIKLEQQQLQLKQLQDERQKCILQHNESRAQLEDEKSGLIDIVRRTAQLHNEIKSLDLRRDSLSGQKTRLQDRTGRINAEMEELLGRRAQLDRKMQDIQSLLADSQAQMAAQREQLAQLSRERLQCSEALSAARENRSGLRSRQQLLEDLESRLEGVDQGVRQVLQLKQEDPEGYYYIKGMVAELIRADVEYAEFVEAALAGCTQNLVVQDFASLWTHREQLAGLKGRVRMLCLDRLGPFTNGFDYKAYPAIKGRLIDYIRFDPDYEALAWHLLGKTLLVDSLEAAIELAETAPAGYRWITLQGEVLEADGTLHLGPSSGQTGLISRKSELRQLQEQLLELDERIGELQNRSEQYVSQSRHLEKNLQELRTAIYETSTEEIETRSQLEQTDQNLARLKREQPLITSEIENLEQQIQEALQLQQSSQQNLDDLESTNRQRQEKIDRLEEGIRQLEAKEQRFQDEITNVKVLLGQSRQKRISLQEKSAGLQSRLQQSEHTITVLQNDIVNAEENQRASQRSILKSESRISELFMQRQRCQQQSKNLHRKFDEMHREKDMLGEQTHRQQQQVQALQERIHELQIQRNEHALRAENLLQRAREELEIDLQEKFNSYQYQDQDWDAVAAEIAALRQKINRLGNINLDAIAEQEELEERLTALTEQFDDLATARKQLEQLIEQINRESTELFLKNFETIRRNFSELFRKLFGGGRAEIVLEDPEDVLECGIEIIARPPGKPLQSISLLSGGEKTMTAVALLMAIFKSKPSPFCLLDEVDAALDEANVERFNLVVQEFLEKSQFIIITHSRRTMSIANVIYGITMQEQGVSKKVSVRFSSENEDSGNAVA